MEIKEPHEQELTPKEIDDLAAIELGWRIIVIDGVAYKKYEEVKTS
jgi:hypothetical protein